MKVIRYGNMLLLWVLMENIHRVIIYIGIIYIWLTFNYSVKHWCYSNKLEIVHYDHS